MEHNNISDEFEVLSQSIGAQRLSEIYLQLKNVSEEIPWKELSTRGLIDKGKTLSKIAPLIPFLDINDNRGNFFRKADGSNDISAKLWLAEVKQKAQMIQFSKSIWDLFKLESIDRKFLSKIAKLSVEIKNVLTIQEELEKVGIILIFSPSLPKAKVDGTVGLLPFNTPFVGLSLRYSRLDNFWFTLLHELSHIKLHFDQLKKPIIDNLEDEKDDPDHIEAAANYETLEAIVPRRIWSRSDLIYDPYISEQKIKRFAEKIGVHPALIAGRLQREKKRYSKYRKIVDQIDVRTLLWGKK